MVLLLAASLFIAFIVYSLLRKCFKFSTASKQDTPHNKIFPDRYSHPGYPNGKHDARELKRRITFLARHFPNLDEQRLRMMAAAGLRAEVRAGTSLLTSSQYRALGTFGPHPRDYVSDPVLREEWKATSILDVMDAFISCESSSDWSGFLIGMDTGIRGYRSALDCVEAGRILLLQSRTFHQSEDEEFIEKLHEFLAYIRVRPVERLLRLRSNRLGFYRAHVNALIKDAADNKPIELDPPVLVCPINPSVIKLHSTVAFAEEVLALATEQQFKDLPNLCNPNITRLPEPTLANHPVKSELPPNLDDPSWTPLLMPTMRSALPESTSAATQTHGTLEAVDASLDLVFQFLELSEEERETCLTCVGLLKKVSGAKALLKMEKVNDGKHDVIDFIAFLCDLKHGRVAEGQVTDK